MIDYKRLLNKKQFEAVNIVSGPALVLAGAGTGKTHLLTMRTVRLCEIGVNPENILLITFTNKAAKEIKNRVIRTLGNSDGYKITAQTFHSFCANILRTYAKHLNIASNFTIIDVEDSKSLIDDVIEELYPKKTSYVKLPNGGTFCSILTYMRNCGKNLDEAIDLFCPYSKNDKRAIEHVIKVFNKYKLNHNYLDYDDLLVMVNDLFEKNKVVANTVANKFKYIMIDEFQDCNNVQSSLIKNMMSGVHDNLMVVGDDCQSIYAFRGANFRNILNFEKEYPNAKKVILNENYRSQQGILDLANALISNMKYKFEKNLVSVNEGYQRPKLIYTRDQNEEVYDMLREINRLIKFGNSYGDIAILTRTATVQHIEFELMRNNIPYKKYGGVKIFAKAHMKDIIAYLKVLSNYKDELAWKRVLKMQEGIGNKTADKIIDEIIDKNIDGLLEFKKKKFTSALEELHKLFTLLRSQTSVEKILDLLLDSYDGDCVGFYNKYMVKAYSNDHERRLEELKELFPICYEYNEAKKGDDFLTKFVEDIILEGTPSEEAEGVITLSTVHSAKGLEWKYVFLADCTSSNYPSKRSTTEDEIEEEQRLLYVAATRAKKDLFIYVPKMIKVFGKTDICSISPFLTKNGVNRHYLD